MLLQPGLQLQYKRACLGDAPSTFCQQPSTQAAEMNIFSAMLLCLFSIGCFAGSATAQVQEFGPASSRFTIDVPSDWEVSPTPAGVDLASGEKTTFLSIAFGDAKGRTPEEIADELAKKLGFANMTKKAPSLYVMHGEADSGPRKALVLFVEDGRFAVCSMSGKDMKTVAKITDSLKEKKVEAPKPVKAQAKPDAEPAADKDVPSAMGDAFDPSSPPATDAAGEPVKP